MRVLIVDDNAEDRRLLKLNLEHHSCTVIEAQDGLQGLELAKTGKPDLIISDALMPRMDGFQLLRKVKQDAALKSVPFIFYSAVYTGSREAELAISLGAADFIIKPKEPKEFWIDVQSVIEECRLKKERPVEARLIEKEQEYLEKYSTIVAMKLEEKVQELEKALVVQKAAEKSLARQLDLENTMCCVSSRFVGANDMDAAINQSLSDIGVLSGASRAYVFLMSKDNAAYRNTHEWCSEGVQPVIAMARHLPVEAFPWWTERLRQGAVINVDDVSSLPVEAANEKAELARQGVTSVLVLPLMLRERLGGFVGFDHVFGAWKWKEGDIALLRMFSEIISRAIERRQGEEALRESERKYRDISQQFSALLDAIPDNITMQSPDLKVLWANRGAAIGLDAKVSDLSGRYCYELWHGRTAPCVPCPVAKTFNTKEPALETITTPDGRIWELRAVPLFDDEHNVTTVLEVGREISEQRKLEAQLRQAQKMEAIGLLAGGIAHDFNNILTAIIGYGNIALMRLEEKESADHAIEQILASADRASRLTHGLLAFSREQVLQPSPHRLNAIISNIHNLLLRLIGEDIALRTKFADPEIAVQVDRGQIEQVLMNLATNARDAMPQGGDLLIETEAVEISADFIARHGYGETGIFASISITDTGMGMDAEMQKKIFQPFFTTKEPGKGTGLGLAMAYGIIKQHNGFINVYSEPGKGTTFRIYLPVAGAPPEEERPEPKRAEIGGTETVLVAEDDTVVRQLTRQILEEFGYTVIEAEDGEDAVSKFSEHRDAVQLVLVDAIMPKKNGREVYDAVRRIRPDAKVLFMSGYPAEVITKKGILEAGLHFVPKPVSPTDLLKRVRDILDASA
ncbi:MAG: hypothetical protein A2X56_09020 [Nitrospirae bacterium GWC2_57_13]|nr:MAG: hypothetical protein A2X56_09020 [Nitrospirae bacterium GWC2_57_13]